MKTALVLGATGHVGSYLVPRLAAMGYSVIAASRGEKAPYTAADPIWKTVRRVTLRRDDHAGLAALIAEARPAVICDLICYDLPNAEAMVNAIHALPGYDPHLIQIGSIWIYGVKFFVPVTEGHPRIGLYEYGVNKAAIEDYLLGLTERGDLRATVLHPGHISGRGWLPINPQGNLNRQIYEDIRSGKPILLPDAGAATLHHVHSDDIARLIEVCLDRPEISVGQMFHSVSPQAMTLRGFTEFLYRHYGHEPAIEYAPWEEFVARVGQRDADITWDHVRHSPVCSMDKARRLLGYEPAWTGPDTVLNALQSMGLADDGPQEWYR